MNQTIVVNVMHNKAWKSEFLVQNLQKAPEAPEIDP